ncbi:DUF2829 domain-containing protein [Fructilactobacillus myrtifloralis]|uniref:DUF2829 domain-containing protein n=1 Tax=Fructilactobacillus myrtifloralis TaxID=2940301 RepID=A0ABY5BPE9_9LACO|nr:DUF2829 domain-containing protein [Fructilactobacillus myrtifloralis]USS85051.1 DUF2829 domain-containing protein [Fructilactobacillus myrtifloralis]
MTIIEATKQAQEKKCGITRPYKGQVFACIYPTDRSFQFTLLEPFKDDGSEDWHPTPEDVLANDWELYEKKP